MKDVIKHFIYGFVLILFTSIFVAESISLDIDPIVLAGAFLAYYKAAKEIDEMIKSGHKYNEDKHGTPE